MTGLNLDLGCNTPTSQCHESSLEQIPALVIPNRSASTNSLLRSIWRRLFHN